LLEALLENINSKMEPHVLLPERYRLHKLSGQYNDCWGCHIEPDWMLVYRLNDEEIALVRTGTHSELVNKLKR